MFVWNMLGALVLLPALSRWLLKTDAAVPRAAAPVPVLPEAA